MARMRRFAGPLRSTSKPSARKASLQSSAASASAGLTTSSIGTSSGWLARVPAR
jgi:hypothetical protein